MIHTDSTTVVAPGGNTVSRAVPATCPSSKGIMAAVTMNPSKCLHADGSMGAAEAGDPFDGHGDERRGGRDERVHGLASR